MAVRLIRDPAEARRVSREARAAGRRLALVPTMGALHAGHGSLVEVARERADVVMLTVFVNPTQFGPAEDFDAYPRDLQGDVARAGEAGADLVFAPDRAAIYPEGDATRVEVERLSDRLCGRSRPGHFGGVATVVTKLLLLCEPHVAVFGRKDYQQWRVLQRMVRDLFLDVEIVGAPIVRDADGLALSSRNAFLSAEERRAALSLPRALAAGAAAVDAGERDPSRVIERMAAVAREESRVRVDYLEVVDAGELAPIERLSGETLLAGAIFVGSTRLIDNREVNVNRGKGR